VRTTVAFYPPPVYHPDAVGAAGRGRMKMKMKMKMMKINRHLISIPETRLEGTPRRERQVEDVWLRSNYCKSGLNIETLGVTSSSKNFMFNE